MPNILNTLKKNAKLLSDYRNILMNFYINFITLEKTYLLTQNSTDMKRFLSVHYILAMSIMISVLFLINSCKSGGNEEDLRQLITEIEAKVIPLQSKINLAEYEAAVSGNDADYKKAAQLNIKLTEIYSDKEVYKNLGKFKKSGIVQDGLLKRQLEVYFNEYKFHQVPTEKMAKMINESSAIAKKFSTYRAELGAKKLTDNQIESILSTSTDNDELKATWQASKQVGALIADDLIRLVKDRNEAAKIAGFDNYHQMRLTLQGQDPTKIEKIFDDLDLLIKQPYAQLKYDMDDFLSARLNIKPEDLRPWHYQNRYFQQAPEIYKIDLDQYYKDKDVVEIGQKYYSGIGLDIKEIIKYSDLKEKSGKQQLSEAMDIDRNGNVRVVANLQDSEYSMYLMLYEFGWASYFQNIDRNLPWSLRTPAHFFTTDAVASFFGNLSKDPVWISEMIEVPKEEIEAQSDNIKKARRLESFVFAAWSQVMYRFEKSLYENPDQNLNKLWWDLVEKYQLIRRPENRDNPDWATKAHIITHPCTYYSYMLGELFAAQIATYIMENIAEKNEDGKVTYCNNPAIGEYFVDKVFRPGSKYNWNDLVKYATGEELSPDYFKNRIIY